MPTEIPVNESTAGMSTVTGFFEHNSVVLHIGDELVTFGGVSQEPPCASNFGRSRGSFCKSASRVTMARPRAARMPAHNAADCPQLNLNRWARMRGSPAARRSRNSHVRSLAAIVGDDDLIRQPERLHRLAERSDERQQIPLLVVAHVAVGCIVRTTAEVLILPLPAQRFRRVVDPATGYAELVIEPRGASS